MSTEPSLDDTKNIVYSSGTENYSPKESEVHISNSCFAREIVYEGCGGAINYLSGGSMFIEFTSFISCICNQLGGAVFQQNGECVLNKCCGISCFCTLDNYYGQFYYSQLTDDIMKKNQINDTSVALSFDQSRKEASQGYTLYMWFGDVRVNTVNVSNNNCKVNSAIVFYPSTNNEKVSASISYSTITRNNSTNSRVISFTTDNALYEIVSSNIIQNTTPSETEGMIKVRGNTKISGCCIYENDSPYLLQGVISAGGFITLLNCTITESDTKKIIGAVTVDLYSPVHCSFINKIIGTQTEKCAQAEVDEKIIHSKFGKCKEKVCNTFLSFHIQRCFSYLSFMFLFY